MHPSLEIGPFDTDVASEGNSQMAIGNTSHAQARQTVAMLRLTLKHPAEWTSHVVVIEHGELNAWIKHLRKHRFAFEAELISASEMAGA